MGSDVSRVRFDVLRDHSGVLMQQGRVLLDADWNELVAILDRRLRANALDLGSTGPRPGIAGVAVVPRTTPDGFLVEAAGGDLTIGLGRMYVDGLVAENHGDPADSFDPMLEERVGSAPVDYDDQPYWPTPDALPESGSHLVYLDVWEREVTPLEAPHLVEQALGVDTTTRMQTVWQVRVHENDGSTIACDAPDDAIPGWSAVIAPSGGRLTTDTIEVDDEDDPCELPPSGGYRGPENQTYRVEVHTGGPAGTATFKWSRDNASIASRVVEVVSATRLRPASLGRDDVLRLRTGDWVEITDDHRELDQRPGELRRIEVHEEDGTISFDDALPAELQMDAAAAASRNLRVRRWDQAGEVLLADGTVHTDLDAAAATGEILVPTGGAAVVLEHGITVSLTTDGGDFRSGDHWIFVARTADTSVEELVEEPPLGVHHHYARLAIVTFPDGETDCRVHWPPEPGDVQPSESCGDCTVCVTPVSHATGVLTIQDAVDQVRTDGGTVCLARGRYDLQEPIDLTGARSVRVTGQGPATLITTSSIGVLMDRAIAVTIEDLAILGGEAAPLVVARTTAGTTLRRLVLVNAAALAGIIDGDDDGDDGDDDGDMSGPEEIVGGRRGRMSRLATRGLSAPAIELSGVVLRPQLRDNVLVAPVGIAGGGAVTRLRESPRDGSALVLSMEVSGNVVIAESVGMWMIGAVAYLGTSTVRDNTVLWGTLGGIATGGWVGPGSTVTVAANSLSVGGSGIGVGVGGFTVRDNSIDGPGEPRGDAIGIIVGSTFQIAPPGPVRIIDNHVREVGAAGIEVLVPVTDLDIRGNVVEATATGILMSQAASAGTVTVAHNVVRDVGGRNGDEVPTGAVGIQVQGADRAVVTGNTVDGVGTARAAAIGAAGIRVIATGDPRIADNRVTRIGPLEDPPPGAGIHVGALYGRAQVSGNTVDRTVGDVDGGPGRFTGLLLGVPSDPESGAAPDWVEAAAEDGTGWVLTTAAAFAMPIRRSAAIVDGNVAGGSQDGHAASIRTTGDLTISGNQLRQPRDTGLPALLGAADTAAVQGNRVEGGEVSIDLDVDPERVAVVANLVTSEIHVGGASLAPPWDALNPGGI